MLSFESDYIQGAHEEILKRLLETNMEALSGYSTDKYCASAREKIKKACGKEEAQVFFLVGGTQANAVVISTSLKNFEGVISAKTGHIHGHEAGAVEFTGHKVLELPQHNGKIDGDELNTFVSSFYADDNHEHMVFPKMVYISHPTEYGTLYTKAELEKISEICKKFDMQLFLDGARLGYGLMSSSTDVTIKDIAELCDVFYIGGTKVGALCGEAVVFTHNNAPEHFMTQVKQHGAMIAKGRLLGIQFDTLFTDDLYFKISAHAIKMADKLKKLFEEKGYKFFIDSPTNQQFIVIENSFMEQLKKKVRFGFWEKYDDSHTVVRFATSWATRDEDIEELAKLI